MAEKSFHKVLFKNTFLFGSSQVIKIIARIITNKFAAIFLGTSGIGIIGLLENAVLLIQGMTNFGINQSSVREVALLSGESNWDNEAKESRLIKIVYNWAILVGLFGAAVYLLSYKYINKEVFNSSEFDIWVLVFAIYFVISAIFSIRLSILQAKKMIKRIVSLQVVSAISSAILAATIYYNLGKKGIIPFLLCSVFIQFMYSLYLTRDFRVAKDKISLKNTILEGMPMLKIGLLLSVSAIFGQFCFFIIRFYLKEKASFDILGIYQVSNVILVGYMGFIFAAMSNDFYPRLCNYGSPKDKITFNKLINQQTEQALYIVVPAIVFLYALAPLIVKFLYSIDFLKVLLILKIGLVSVIVKAIVWPIGHIPLVKGNKILFLKQIILGDGANVIGSICFFHFFGLIGLGVSMVAMFILSLVYNYYTARKYYGFSYEKSTLKIVLISLVIGVLSVTAIFCVGFKDFNYPFLILGVLSVTYSFRKIKGILIK
ncbi:O-antigen translocase [Flavobacteriaceae bacterium MHTCC 0001]